MRSWMMRWPCMSAQRESLVGGVAAGPAQAELSTVVGAALATIADAEVDPGMGQEKRLPGQRPRAIARRGVPGLADRRKQRGLGRRSGPVILPLAAPGSQSEAKINRRVRRFPV